MVARPSTLHDRIWIVERMLYTLWRILYCLVYRVWTRCIGRSAGMFGGWLSGDCLYYTEAQVSDIILFDWPLILWLGRIRGSCNSLNIRTRVERRRKSAVRVSLSRNGLVVQQTWSKQFARQRRRLRVWCGGSPDAIEPNWRGEARTSGFHLEAENGGWVSKFWGGKRANKSRRKKSVTDNPEETKAGWHRRKRRLRSRVIIWS